MKSQLIVFFVLLIASSQASRLMLQHPLDFSSERNLMQVYLQVQEAIKAGGPMDDIIKFLDDLRDKIQAEQKSHDAVFSKNKQDCKDERDFRVKEIQEGKAANATAQQQLANCRASLKRAESDLAQNLENQRQTRAELQNLIDQRRRDNELFLSRVNDHKQALAAIDYALTLLDEIFSGAAGFTELSKTSISLMQSAINLRQAEHFAPILSVFAQIASKKVLGDTAALEKVRALLKHLRGNVQKSWDEYSSQEQKDVATFNAKKTQLLQEIAKLEKAEEALRNHIADMKLCIGTQIAIINAAEKKVSRNVDLLNIAKKMCHNFANDFKLSSQKRQSEQALVAKIKEIIMSRFKEFSQNISERGHQSVGEWAAHKNTNVYDPAEAFKRAQGTLNQSGADQAGFKLDQNLAKAI